MGNYTNYESWKESIVAGIRQLRSDKTIAESRAAQFESRIAALQEKLSMPIWAELESGSTVRIGTKVRYMLRVYECIAEHTKALTRLPTNGNYWQEVSD